MNLMELMNSQLFLGKYITRPIYILSTTRIPGLADIHSVQTSVSVNTTIIMMNVDAIIHYPCTN